MYDVALPTAPCGWSSTLPVTGSPSGMSPILPATPVPRSCSTLPSTLPGVMSL